MKNYRFHHSCEFQFSKMNYLLGGFLKCRKQCLLFTTLPHSTSICKFDHSYLLEIWVSFWRFYLNFGEIPPYLTLKYISKMKFVLHMGDLIQKNDFFLLCFFQFHQHVVTFSSKNYVKMKSSIVKTITKNSSKIEKIMKFFHRFSNIWHEFDKKNQRFYWIFTYG